MPRLTATEVLEQAKELQKEFKAINAHWSLYACAESICENDTNVVFDNDRLTALREAAKIDNGQA